MKSPTINPTVDRNARMQIAALEVNVKEQSKMIKRLQEQQKLLMKKTQPK
tara:strand:+ start:1421 stop:1570 length:150 start_codon:yes stop_codon:yes gene_type:complete